MPGQSQAEAASARVGTNSSSQRVKLGLNKSVVIDLPADAYDILVANPAVADAVTRTSRRIYLFGKSVGQTNIFVFGPNGEQIVSLDLAVERDVAGLEDYIKRFIPEFAHQGRADQRQRRADRHRRHAARRQARGRPGDDLRHRRRGDDRPVFADRDRRLRQRRRRHQQSRPDAPEVSSIVNLLQIVGEDQVMLKVTVAEVSRTVMKQLGVNMIGTGDSNGISWGAISDSIPGLGKPLGASQLSIGTSMLDAYVNAMEQAGVMKTLAEPTLDRRLGREGHLQGRWRIQPGDQPGQAAATGGRTYQIDKIEYGIGLEFQPVVLSPGRISLKIRTAVSEPTMEGSVTLSGGFARRQRFNTPGMNALSLRKRLADTTVELPSGGSMMIAGLVRDDVRQAIDGLPGLSKIPVLGTLFRSRDFVRNETELVIIVTPYLARPVARNELAKPDDNFNAASDGAGMFLGRVNRVYGTMKTDRPVGRYHGVVGFIYK